jgi:hypothetical protein
MPCVASHASRVSGRKWGSPGPKTDIKTSVSRTNATSYLVISLVNLMIHNPSSFEALSSGLFYLTELVEVE